MKNFAWSLVATAPSPATSGTSLVVTTGEGARFEDGDPVAIWPAGEQPHWAAGSAAGGNVELCDASISGDTVTLVRAQYGTSARTVVVGDQIGQNVTKKMLDDLGLYGPGDMAWTQEPRSTWVPIAIGDDITRYQRVTQGLRSVSDIGMWFTTVDATDYQVAVYDNIGVGSAARPGDRQALSGDLVPPGTGYQEGALGSTLDVPVGWWFAVWSQSGTLAVMLSLNASSVVADFLQGEEAGAPPATASASPSTAQIVMTGVA